MQRPILPWNTGLLGLGFILIIIILQKCMQILFTDRALPTIRGMDQMGGGGGGIIAL